MNTGLRRFILRVAVGLLAFLLGVAAAWAITGLNPFQSSSGTIRYKKRCGSHRSWSPPPAEQSYGTVTGTVFPEEGRSGKTKRTFREIPPPPPPPAAPAAPAHPGGS